MHFLFDVLLFVVLPLCGLLYLKSGGIVRYAAQMLVDASQLEILDIGIIKCDEVGFLLSLSARISNTGPLAARIDSMNLSMYSSKSGPAFARVQLPTIIASPSGVICKVVDQRITIEDIEAFNTFSRNLLLQAELPITVKGHSDLTVLGPIPLKTKIDYVKTALINGFDGVHITPLESRKHSRSLIHGKPSDIEVDVTIASTSEVSIDMGIVHVSIVHEAMHQEINIADLRARVFLKPGLNKVTWYGNVDVGEMAKHPLKGMTFLKRDLSKKEPTEAIVIGVSSEQCKWLARTVKEMRSPIKMESTMRDILRSTHHS